MTHLYPVGGTEQSPTGCLLFLEDEAHFHLRGQCRVALWGEPSDRLEVLGWSLSPESEPRALYSPRGSSLVGGQAFKGRSRSRLKVTRRKVLAALDHTGVAQEILRELVSRCVLVYLEPLSSQWSRRLDALMPHFVNMSSLFEPDAQLAPSQVGWSGESERRLNINLVLDDQRSLNPNLRCFSPLPEWDQILPAGNEPGPARLFVTGGKGVGKSTLGRWLLNRLLAQHNRVVWVDLDPGQSELGLPGFVCSALLSAPLLGPNFTHLDRPLHSSFYIGDVNVSQVRTRYEKACQAMCQRLTRDPEAAKYPWVINNMGFAGPVGQNFLIQSLSEWVPTTLVYIRSTSARKNYPTPLARLLQDPRHAMRIVEVNAVPENPAHQSSEKNTSVHKPSPWGLPEPKKLREIVFLSYLSLFPCPVKEMLPFTLPYQNLAIHILSSNHSPQVPGQSMQDPEFLSHLNASIVSLEFDPMANQPNHSRAERSIAPLFPSLGVAFVRGVDLKRKELYIIAHLTDATLLTQVNAISVGVIKLPDSVLFDQSCKTTPPYVSDYLSFKTPLSQPWIKGGRPRTANL